MLTGKILDYEWDGECEKKIVLTGKILDYEWDGECEKKIGIVHDVMIGEFEGEASVLFELAPRDKSDKPNRLTSENQVCFDVSWVHFPSLFLLRCSRRNHSIRNRPGRDREKRRRKKKKKRARRNGQKERRRRRNRHRRDQNQTHRS